MLRRSKIKNKENKEKIKNKKKTTEKIKKKHAKNPAPTALFQNILRASPTVQEERYGDILTDKAPNTFRIAFQNINRLPERSNHHKSKALLHHIDEGQYDVFMLAEVGLRWHALSASDTWHERTRLDLPDNKASFAYNNTEEKRHSEKAQFGGVGVVATQQGKPRVQTIGADKSGMGRWAWMLLQGKEHHSTVIVSAYRPVLNKTSLGSVYMQQLRALHNQNDTRDLLEAFEHNLGQQILEWQAEGYHIIVGMDANENSLDGNMSKMMDSLGLHNVFVESHGSSRTPPITCNKADIAQFPIDAIWCSQAIHAARAGFLAFDEGTPSDHRVLWFDVADSILFGHQVPPIPPKMGHLKSSDPRIVLRYTKKVEAAFANKKLFQRAQLLREIPHQQWSDEHIQEYNAIHALSTEIRLSVEQELNKLRTGAIPWSPKLQTFRDTIELWSMIKKRKEGKQSSTTKIRRLMRKTGLNGALDTSLQKCRENLNTAFQDYKKAKQEAEMWQEDHLENLADALALHHNTSREKQIQNLRLRETQRRLGRSAKRARGKLGSGQVTKVLFMDDDDNLQEATTRKSYGGSNYYGKHPTFQPD